MSKSCEECGVLLESSTGRWCVDCYRKASAPCPNCMKGEVVKGKRVYKCIGRYQKHEGPGGGKKCKRCGEPHDDKRQLVCAVCDNTRIVLEFPSQRKGQGVKEASVDGNPFG